jgi:hypothetical protein
VIRLEMFATGQVAPEQLWRVVGDPWRLAEWTDVESVADVNPDPPTVGGQVTTVEAGTTRSWRITTLDARLLEISTDTERGRLGFGWRVVRDARGGSRLVLAAGVDVRGFTGRIRARMLDVPSLRRRMDRWAHEALRVAAASSR